MSEAAHANTGRIGFVGLLTLLFIGAKLFGQSRGLGGGFCRRFGSPR